MLFRSTDFQLGVVVARLLGVRFALGATIVLRRGQLDQAGGFAALAPYLADDYMLGKAISDRGSRIVLSDYVVETVLPRETWGTSWRHRLRWSRTLRVCRPGGYAGLLLTFAVPLSAAALAAAPSWWPLAAGAMTLRVAAAMAVGARLLGDPLVPRYIFLLPLADLFSFALWIASFFGRQVVWRGDRFRLEPSGRLNPIGTTDEHG